MVDDKDTFFLPLDKLLDNPFPQRWTYSAEKITEMAVSIQERGQADPVHVIPAQEEGFFYVFDGQTRVTAIRDYGLSTTVWVKTHKLTPTAAYWYGYQQNEERTQLNDIDRGLSFWMLLDKGLVKNANEISTKVGLSKTTVSMLLCYSRLHPDILAEMKNFPEKFTCKAAYAIYIFTKSEDVPIKQAIDLVRRFGSSNMTRVDLEAEIRFISKPEKHFQSVAKPLPKPVIRRQSLPFVGGKISLTGDALDVRLDNLDDGAGNTLFDELEQFLRQKFPDRFPSSTKNINRIHSQLQDEVDSTV